MPHARCKHKHTHTHTHTHTHKHTHNTHTHTRRYARKPWQAYINGKNRHLVNNEAIDLLNSMLQYDHQNRPICLEAMKHPYFDPVREEEAKQEAEARGAAGTTGGKATGATEPEAKVTK